MCVSSDEKDCGLRVGTFVVVVTDEESVNGRRGIPAEPYRRFGVRGVEKATIRNIEAI